MDKRWTVVQALRQSRHDWLNKIQLIKGNLALQRIDRVHEIIQEIIVEAQNEAKLTNLRAEQFAELLMTYHWETHIVRMEYEILGEPVDLQMYDEALTNWCRQFLHKLEECSSPHVENYVTITIDLTMRDVRLFFDYRGFLAHIDCMSTFLYRQHELNICEYSISEHELTACVTIHRPTRWKR